MPSISLPSKSETDITFTLDDTEYVLDVVEFDSLHADAVEMARNARRNTYEVLQNILKEKLHVELTKSQIYVLITTKAKIMENIKKNYSTLLT